MKNERTVFVIKGSEDGVIAVVSNMTKAYEQCFSYVDNDSIHSFGAQESKGSFMLDIRKGRARLTRDDAWEVTATAERFYIE